MPFDFDAPALLARLGLIDVSAGGVIGGVTGGVVEESTGGADGPVLACRSAAYGGTLASLRLATSVDYERTAAAVSSSFARLRDVPAPRRGEVLRALGDAFRGSKADLGALISLEVGKIRAEGEGEIQEIIDICDYACGLSRMLGGHTLPSERPHHRLMEQWHPLGPVGVITAFNFPAAVWGWNAAIAFACGDPVLWKPSLKAPLTALACQRLADQVLARFGLSGTMAVVVGTDDVVGAALIDDRRFPLISATGSTRMGRAVQQRVHARFGRTLLELGGNNALIVLDDANLDLALRAVVFGAVGTAGQRCTTTRRLLVQRGVAHHFTKRLQRAYGQVKVGDPLEEGTLMGPLVDEDAARRMQEALTAARAQGGEVLCGGRRLLEGFPDGTAYVEPALVRSHAGMAIVKEEVFAPILHILAVGDLDEAIARNNEVDHGLSSSLFSTSQASAERFLSAAGSDCGIANVNVGTSGAEIGGAFGGEKETGGGRESGSDSWKAYMRRQTNTVNHGDSLPLSQGIVFDVG